MPSWLRFGSGVAGPRLTPDRTLLASGVSRALLALALLLGLAPAQERDTLRVLFVGNSHTYVNDVPGLFESLAVSAGRFAFSDLSAPGGYTLEQHSQLRQTLDMITRDSWNFVVLQEQSQIPSINSQRFGHMYPACRRLDSLILAHGESTAFYMTWGWRDGGTMYFGGDSSPCFRDYFEMQDSVAAAYRMIADELGSTLCPVGLAWARARRRVPTITLWQDDMCHATLMGSYLAACVFYGRLFDADPTGLPFTAGLAPDTALFLQTMAAQTLALVEHDGRPPVALDLVVRPPIGRGPFQFEPRSSPILILDPAGRTVRTLGAGSVGWDTRDEAGTPAQPGVYFAVTDSARARLVLVH